MPGDHADIAPHHLHAAKFTAKAARLAEYKALRPHAHINLLIGNARNAKHGILSQIQPATPALPGKHIDRRRAKEPGHKQICRIVIDRLRLPDLLYHSFFHHHNPVGNAHGLFLIMGHENGGNTGLPLNPSDLFPCLEAQAGVQIR